MAINEEVIRFKKYKTDANGNHSLISQWTRSDTIEMIDGKTLEEALDGATGIVEILQADYDDLSEEQKNNGQIYHIIDGVETRITTDDIGYKGETLTNGLNGLEEQLGTIEDEIDSQNEHLSILDTNYETLNTKVGTVESDVSSNTTKITNIETKLSMITGTLSAGSTSITLTDERITTDSVFRFFTSKFGVSPTGATVNNGSIILTFEAQSEPLTVGVKLE